MSRRRLLIALPALVAVLAIGYLSYQTWQIERELSEAQTGGTALQAALDSGDVQARTRAVQQLTDGAAAAAGRTDSLWWRALTHAPFVGDDATGVRALSRSLDTIATGAVQPLTDSVDQLDGLSAHGTISLEVLHGLDAPIARASRAFASADADITGLDSSGYAGPLKTRFEKYVALVDSTSSALSSAETTVQVLPQMLGEGGPQDYLLIFQNNAEIRATGGMPGSWALLHADEGKLTLTRQGTALDFPVLDKPVLPLSAGERQVYDDQLGVYFQDAGFTPDFPRTAELWSAHWDRRFPGTPLAGVLALDPVGLSYLLAGTGPIQVGSTTLTSDNLVETLLNKPYLELEPAAQDALFQQAAKAIFEASTAKLASPLDFARGLGRAATEGRLMVASFDPTVQAELSGTRVEGALSGDDGATPHVDIGINDATGSKMSYYLRYWADVQALDCSAGVQRLSGSMTLRQTISPAEAVKLPVSVTGGADFGTERGSQLVLVNIYGPAAGAIEDMKLNGKVLPGLEAIQLFGRPVVTVAVLLSNRADIVLTWSMETAKGQVGDIQLGMTPSLVSRNHGEMSANACS